MNTIMRPRRWWDMVSPREEEMPDFLRAYMGKGMQFRTPKHMWEDLWRLKRGEVNDVLGIRSAQSISNRFKGPKYQRGLLHPIGFYKEPAAGGTEPDLSDITHDRSGANPIRIHIAYDSDGTILHYFGGALGSVVYTQLTTQTDDANDHTSEWWPDSPETNEGLNWDIRYTNVTNAFTSAFNSTGSPLFRLEDSWYLLDDVSNDVADGTNAGAMRVQVSGKGAGTVDGIGDIEIRATGSGSAVASHTLDLQALGTG